MTTRRGFLGLLAAVIAAPIAAYKISTKRAIEPFAFKVTYWRRTATGELVKIGERLSGSHVIGSWRWDRHLEILRRANVKT